MKFIKFAVNYADEFDVYGFTICNEKILEQTIENLKKYFSENENMEMYFGTNEAIEIGSIEQALSEIKPKDIGLTQAEVVARLFGFTGQFNEDTFYNWGGFNLGDINEYLSDYQDYE